MKTITVTFKNQIPKVNDRITSRYGDSSGRSVYVSSDGKYILKVDDRGYHHDDVGVYSCIEPDDRKYFVPVLAHGKTENGDAWSVQEFLNLSGKKSDDDENLVDDLTDKYGLEDINSSNWGLHKGQPIIFDYGIAFSSSD